MTCLCGELYNNWPKLLFKGWRRWLKLCITLGVGSVICFRWNCRKPNILFWWSEYFIIHSVSWKFVQNIVDDHFSPFWTNLIFQSISSISFEEGYVIHGLSIFQDAESPQFHPLLKWIRENAESLNEVLWMLWCETRQWVQSRGHFSLKLCWIQEEMKGLCCHQLAFINPVNAKTLVYVLHFI